MDRLKNFCAWAANLAFRDIPNDVLTRSRLQVMNTLAAMVAGRRTDPGAWHYREGSGPCQRFGEGSADAASAYFEYATDSMRHDFDDYLFMAHSCHSAVLAPLAVGQEVNASGREFLKAVVVANELEGRLGASTVLGPHNGQMWSFLHAAGAAVTTALLKNGDAEAVFHALALSLYNPNYPNTAGFMGGDSKNLTASIPGASGIRIGNRALAGDRAYPEIFEDEKGFLSSYAYVSLPEMMGGAGETWVTRTVSFKPVPGCAYLQAPMQAYTELREEHGFSGNDVESVDVDASLVTLLMESHSAPFWQAGPLTPVNVTFSVELGLGLAILEDDYGVSHLDREYLRVNSDRIRETADRVSLRHDWSRTVDVMRGITAAVDLQPLVGNRGLWTILGGVRKMRREHEGLSTGRELFNLALSGQVRNVLELFASPLDWDEFDLARAQLDDLRFNFGCELTVTLDSGERLARDLSGHRGRADGDPSTQKPIVKGKLWEQADAFYAGDRAEMLVDTVQDLPTSSLGVLTEVLFD